MPVELFLGELLLVLPIIVGLAAIGHVIYSYPRREAASIVMRCYLLSVIILFVGAIGTWRSGLAMWAAVGVAGDISMELLYSGWRRSWWPVIVAAGAIVPLVGIATAAVNRRAVPTARRPMELQIVLAIPAAVILLFVLIGLAVEMIFEPLAYPYRLPEIDPITYWLLAIGAVGYFALALFGIPYAIIWGLVLKRHSKEQSAAKSHRAIGAFYYFFALIAIGFTVLVFLAFIQGRNPLLGV